MHHVLRLVDRITDAQISPRFAFSSGGGGTRPERPAGRPDAGPRSGTRPTGYSTGGGGRPPRGGPPAPRPERYWTDYLRIALPVIGLILMLSVFIFWVDRIIGDDGGTPETPVAVSTATIDPNAVQATATLPVTEATVDPTQPADGGSDTAATETAAAETEATDEPTAEATEETAAEPTDEPTDEATEEPASDGEFAAGDEVTTNTSVNMREEPAVDGTLVVTLEPDTTLTIISGPETADDFDWYEVESDSGDTGWVASEFFDAASG